MLYTIMDETLFLEKLYLRNDKCFQVFPDKAATESFVSDLFQLLFIPKNNGEGGLLAIQRDYADLRVRFQSMIKGFIQEELPADAIIRRFFEQLPNVYDALLEDAHAILQSDPAAQTLEEVLVAYPGFFATAVYRFSHVLWHLNLKILGRMFTEYAHSKTGIDIHPGAQIGHAFSIDHGTGVVIGETSVLGNHVKLYQGVTLGALSVDKKDAATKRHPTIEDNVVIYSGATILGGDTIIGHDSIIGGNVWLTYSVEPYSVVYHKSEIKVRDNNPFPEPLNFVI
ncbi:serine O-acetyltransferase [Hydrotalea flava]|uniref:serine O-acetyltransferase n=1 Tax=Hydrotalea flava TaxID=714549 RepID=UPI000A74B1BD|nr:serine O-acetyltransferase [Hydrotalea flava]